MKPVLRFLPLAVCTLLSAAVYTRAQDPAQSPPLTNREVLGMVQAGLSAEIVAAKIKASRCAFDTRPSVLAELKQQGVPDAVLLAMVQAPYGAPAGVEGAAVPSQKAEGQARAGSVPRPPPPPLRPPAKRTCAARSE